MTSEQITAFAADAGADGWALRASMHPETGVPSDQMGELSRGGVIINFVSLDEPLKVERQGRSKSYEPQHWMRGVNAKGWPFDVPETYDPTEIETRAAAAIAPEE